MHTSEMPKIFKFPFLLSSSFQETKKKINKQINKQINKNRNLSPGKITKFLRREANSEVGRRRRDIPTRRNRNVPAGRRRTCGGNDGCPRTVCNPSQPFWIPPGFLQRAWGGVERRGRRQEARWGGEGRGGGCGYGCPRLIFQMSKDRGHEAILLILDVAAVSPLGGRSTSFLPLSILFFSTRFPSLLDFFFLLLVVSFSSIFFLLSKSFFLNRRRFVEVVLRSIFIFDRRNWRAEPFCILHRTISLKNLQIRMRRYGMRSYL